MKMKKALALLLTVVMLAGMFTVSVSAAAGEVGDYTFKIVGTNDSASGIVSYAIQANTSGKDLTALAIALKYDSTMIQPCKPAGDVVSSGTTFLTVAPGITDGGEAFTKTGTGLFTLNASTGAMMINMNAPADDMLICSAFTTMATLTFKVVGSGSFTKNTLRLAEKSDLSGSAEANHISGVDLLMFGTGVGSHCYGTIDGGKTDDASASQISISYTNVELPAASLNSFSIKKGNTAASDETVTVPTAVEAKTDNNEIGILTLTAGAIDEDSQAMAFPADATWALHENNVGNPAEDALEDLPDGVTVEQDGANVTLTVAPNAAVSNGDIYHLVVAKGNVKASCKVTIAKAASAVTTVTVSPSGNVIVPIPAAGAAANATKVFTATVKDQYGVDVESGTVTWAFNPNDSTHIEGAASGSNPTDKTYTVTVKPDATPEDVELTATIGGKSATATVKVMGAKPVEPGTVSDGTAPVFPYTADTTAGAVFDDQDKVDALAAVVATAPAGITGKWALADDTETLTWGENTIHVKYVLTGDDPQYVPEGSEGAGVPYADSENIAVKVYLKKHVDASNVTIDSRAYNGTADVTASDAHVALAAGKGGFADGTTQKVVGTYADKVPGTHVVTLSSITFTLNDAAKTYYYDTADLTTNKTVASCVIEKASVTISANATAEANINNYTLDDLVTVTGLGKGDTLADLVGDGAIIKFWEQTDDTPTYTLVEEPEVGTEYYVDITISKTGLSNYTDITKNMNATGQATNDGVTTATGVSGLSKVVFKKTMLASSFTVSYKAGEHGKIEGAASEIVDRDEYPVNVPTPVADKGFKFVGWTIDGINYVDPTATKINTTIVFTAKFEAEAAKPGYIWGDDTGNFRPQATASRAELATMLARLCKEYDPNGNYSTEASDIPAGKWYAAPMRFMAQMGIMTGDGNGSFRPESEITRGEFAVMLVRYLKLDTAVNEGFDDVTGWAAPYANALKKAGIVNGYPDGTFRAENKLTRAEAVTMINNAINLHYDAEATYENTFNDVPDASAHWAYKDIVAASNTPLDDFLR